MSVPTYPGGAQLERQNTTAPIVIVKAKIEPPVHSSIRMSILTHILLRVIPGRYKRLPEKTPRCQVYEIDSMRVNSDSIQNAVDDDISENTG